MLCYIIKKKQGYLLNLLLFIAIISTISIKSSYANDYTFNFGNTTASVINAGRNIQMTTDVVTFASLSCNLTMNEVINLSDGGIVADSIALSILNGVNALTAKNVTINGAGGSVTNDNVVATGITNLILNGGTFTNNETLSGDITTLSVTADSSRINGTAAVTVTNTPTLNFNLEIDGAGVKTFTNGINISASKSLTVTGTGAHVFGATTLSGTLINNDANLAAITSVDVAADTAKIDGTGATTIINQVVVDNNLELDGAGVKTFTSGVDINAGNSLTVTGTGAHVLGATTLSGTLINNDANLAAITSVDVAADTATIGGTGATTITNALLVDNNLALAGTGVKTFNGAVTFTGNKTMSIGSSTRVVSGAGIDTTGGGVISLDLGTGTTGSRISGDLFSQVNGAVTVSAAVGGTLNDIRATGGISGVSYEVFTTALTGGSLNDFISTNSTTLTYKLVNDGTSGILGNILVEAASSSAFQNSGVNSGTSNVTGGVSRALDIINEDSSQYNSEIQTLMSQLGALNGDSAVAQAMVELSGTDVQGSNAQSSLIGISKSSSALRGQMTSFRSGSLSSALASTYTSGGATAALNDMADADELNSAFELHDSKPEYQKGVSCFVKTFGGYGEQGSDAGYTGYYMYNAGALVGADYTFGSDFRVGGYIGYSHNYADIYNNLGYSIDDTIRLGGYGSYQYDRLFVDISPSVGVHIFETKRNINSVIGAKATGERTGVDFNISGTLGYMFELPYEVNITPSYSLEYTILHDPEYTETGAGGANLKVKSFDTNSLLQNLQININKLLEINDRVTLLPELWAGWELEYLNTGGNLTAAFAGASNISFNNRINGTDMNRAIFGVGATALIDENISKVV